MIVEGTASFKTWKSELYGEHFSKIKSFMLNLML